MSAEAASSDALLAGTVAGLLSGAPSTITALIKRDDPLEATLAAGTVLLPREQRRGRLFAAAAVVHGLLSVGWALVLSAVLPRRATIRWALPAGLAIALLDLGIIGRHFERIRALPTLPQVADHLAYAVTVGAVLSARRSRRVEERSTASLPRTPGARDR